MTAIAYDVKAARADTQAGLSCSCGSRCLDVRSRLKSTRQWSDLSLFELDVFMVVQRKVKPSTSVLVHFDPRDRPYDTSSGDQRPNPPFLTPHPGGRCCSRPRWFCAHGTLSPNHVNNSFPTHRTVH